MASTAPGHHVHRHPEGSYSCINRLIGSVKEVSTEDKDGLFVKQAHHMAKDEKFMNVNIVLVKHKWQGLLSCAEYTLAFNGKTSLHYHLSCI